MGLQYGRWMHRGTLLDSISMQSTVYVQVFTRMPFMMCLDPQSVNTKEQLLSLKLGPEQYHPAILQAGTPQEPDPRWRGSCFNRTTHYDPCAQIKRVVYDVRVLLFLFGQPLLWRGRSWKKMQAGQSELPEQWLSFGSFCVQVSPFC